MATSKQSTGRNTTAITNPKTKSQNTTANTTVQGGKKMAGQSGVSAGASSKTAGKSASSKSSAPKSASSQTASKSGTSSAKTASKSSSKQSMQSSGKVNAKMEAAADCSLKDMDIISDILGGQKALIKLYGTAICECDCARLRTILNSQLSEAATDQFDAFLYMNQRGMYPTEQAPSPKVKKAVQQYTQKGSAFKK